MLKTTANVCFALPVCSNVSGGLTVQSRESVAASISLPLVAETVTASVQWWNSHAYLVWLFKYNIAFEAPCVIREGV